MTLKNNILANYLGAGIVSLTPILALPWYLNALGPNQFGLIGFIVMLQALLGLLDAGMSQALVREFTIRLNSENTSRHSTASLLFGFERIYWMFAICAGCVTVLLADTIATHWLNLGSLPVSLGKQTVYGAAAIFAVQFPGSVYRSMLVGAQVQVTLNVILSCSMLLRHIGGVIVVIICPTIPAYLIWYASIALLETLIRGRLAWKTLNVKRNQVKWEIKELLPVWRTVATMSGAAWLGALTVQMDRIILSRMATMTQFGYYTVAATAATGVLQMVYPLVQAFLPRAIQLKADPDALRKISFKLAWLIGISVGFGGVVFSFFGEWLLKIWLRNAESVAAVHQVLAILLVGTALNAFYNVGYVNWLTHGKIYRVFQVNTLALVLSAALIPPLVAWQGTIGAAFGWVAINLIGFALSLGWIKRNPGERTC